MCCAKIKCFILQLKASAYASCVNIGSPDIFGDCADSLDWTDFRLDCEYDMCSRSNLSNKFPLCLWMIAAAHKCAQYGFTVDWINKPEFAAVCVQSGLQIHFLYFLAFVGGLDICCQLSLY